SRDVIREGVDPHVDDVLRVVRNRNPPRERRARNRERPQAALDERDDLVPARFRLHELRILGEMIEQRLLISVERKNPARLALALQLLVGMQRTFSAALAHFVLGLELLAADAVIALEMSEREV